VKVYGSVPRRAVSEAAPGALPRDPREVAWTKTAVGTGGREAGKQGSREAGQPTGTRISGHKRAEGREEMDR
jgi:hypothetical protein